ncbi:MAG TPA: SprT family zinc-dependent metalloprotease [Chloroflexota bacterium]
MHRKWREEVARGEIELGSQTVAYSFIRSDRARSVRISITPESTVEVVLPRRAPLPSIESVLVPKSRWIIRHLQRLDAERSQRSEHLPYLGSEYRLDVRRVDASRPTLALAERSIRVTLPEDGQVWPAVEAWYREQAGAVLHARIEHWAGIMGTPYRRITIRDQRTRWASCSTAGNLNFSWRLIMAPLAVLDYVVIHELMHTVEMNHSARFWSGVARYCPGYAEHRDWLRHNGTMLAQALTGEAPERPRQMPLLEL